MTLAQASKDTAEALRWYRKAGDQGYAAAQYNLGQAYNLGNGVEKDTAEAARWWQKAAEQGLAKAQYNLGLAYHDGIGVQKDNLEAYFWIAIAAKSLEQGFVKDHRDKAEALLTAPQLADVQERIRKWVEAHPATQTASLNSLPSVPQDQQQQTQTQDHPQAATAQANSTATAIAANPRNKSRAATRFSMPRPMGLDYSNRDESTIYPVNRRTKLALTHFWCSSFH